MKVKVAFLLIFLLLPCILLAQLKKDTKPVDMPSRIAYGNNTVGSVFNMLGLDPAKFHMSHSYQMSYFSGMGASGTLGLYLNTMSYQFSNYLDMTLQLGIAHQPFGGNVGNSATLMNSPFVSGAQIRYKPSDKFQIELDYRSLPYSSMGYYSSPYNRMYWDEN